MYTNQRRQRPEPVTSYIIADSDSLDCAKLRRALADEPALSLVGETRRGARLLELCQELAPQLVLVDLGLPDIDALDLIRQLTLRFPKTQVLAISSSEQSALILAVFEAGAAGFVLKDASPQELRGAVHHTIGGQRFLNGALAARLLRQVASTPSRPS